MKIISEKIWYWIEHILWILIVRILHFHLIERNWQSFMQFVKFGVVGLSNTLISYVSYLVFLKIGLYYLAASILSFVVSVTNSFYWNNKYVFAVKNDEKRSWWRTYIKTFMAYASTGLVLANVLLVIWVQVLHISEVIAPIINLLVTIPLNYIINKCWAFKTK